MKVTEDNYVDMMKGHQEKALKYFIDQHGWVIKTIIYQQLYNYPDSREECMNDVFLSIWEHIDSYDEIKGSFLTWVAAIAKYKAISYLRSQSRERIHENIDDIDIESPIVVSSGLVKQEEEEAFYDLIRCLSKEDQNIFIKHFIEEKSNEEISVETGLRRDVIYNRLSRGKKKIKHTMESRC